MNNEPQLYEAVSVETHAKDMPKGKDFVLLFDNGEIRRNQEDQFPFAIATHWLRPLSNHVPISREKKEALEKCVEEVKISIERSLRNLEKLNNHTWNVYKEQIQEHLSEAIEALSNLNTIK